MTAPTITGYAAGAVGQPLEPFTYEPPELSEHDVRVSVTHCGVCHTDVQAISDYYGITTFPFVPGHEIVRYVTAVGPGVEGLKVGDPSMIRAMLSFAQRHGITPMVELMPLSRVNEAIQRLKENRARYRIVLVNDAVGAEGRVDSTHTTRAIPQTARDAA